MKGKDLGKATEVQNIARQMNLHGGFNLNKIHRLTLDFPDPPQGYGSLYMDREALAALKQKLREDSAGPHGKGYHAWLYRAEPYSRPLVDMWKDESGGKLDAAVAAVRKTAHGMLDAYVNGDGIYDFHYHYWHGGLAMMRHGIWIDQILSDERSTGEQRRQMKAAATLFANVLWDNDLVPLDNAHGLNLGTANMPVQQTGYRHFYAVMLARHPAMRENARRVEESVRRMVKRLINKHGAEIGCPHYMGASFAPTLNTLLQIKQQGKSDPFAQEPRLAKFAEFFMQLMTPPEPRLDGKRGFIPLGDGSIEPSEMLGELATGFRDANPELSKRLMGMWLENGKPHSGFFGCTFFMIDERLPQASPNLGDASFPGYMSVLRNDYGTRNETAVWLIAGDWHSDHRHNDHGSVIIYALGQPLSNDWSAIYTPHTPGSYTKSAVVFADSIKGGWAKDSPGVNVGTAWRSGSEQEKLRSFPEGAYTRAWMKTGSKDKQSKWTREVIKIHADPAHPVIVIRDRFAGARAAAAKVMTLNLVAQGAVATAVGSITPVPRKHPRVGHNPKDPKHLLPSTSRIIKLTSGIQRFGFIGSQGIDFDVYTVGAKREAIIGNWAAPIWGGHARNRYESQHILRIKGRGPFTTLIIPWRKGDKPSGLKVARKAKTIIISDGKTRTIIEPDGYRVKVKNKEIRRSFR